MSARCRGTRACHYRNPPNGTDFSRQAVIALPEAL